MKKLVIVAVVAVAVVGLAAIGYAKYNADAAEDEEIEYTHFPE